MCKLYIKIYKYDVHTYSDHILIILLSETRNHHICAYSDTWNFCMNIEERIKKQKYEIIVRQQSQNLLLLKKLKA